MKNIVVIPVYKEHPTHPELISLRQCLRILNKHTVYLVAPENLETAIYQSIFNEYNVPLKIELFEMSFFCSAMGYNRLLLKRFFYERFADFDYMLIYQLDAYVFKDDLDYWCSKGYDYIGAPWMKLNGKLDKENSGNGGFSLRKIQSFIDLFSHKGKILTYKGLLCYHRYRGPLHKPWLVLLGLLGLYNTLKSFTEDQVENEDLFFVTLKYKRGKKFNIPSSQTAMLFSFEEKPSLLFEQTGNTLPFGCHAWKKYEYDSFWKNFIPLDQYYNESIDA
jgi:hypothetical protein